MIGMSNAHNLGSYSVPSESVTVNVTADNGVLPDEFLITITNSAGNVLFTSSESTFSIKIPYGTVYTVSASAAEGYDTPTDQTFTAALNTNNVSIIYCESMQIYWATQSGTWNSSSSSSAVDGLSWTCVSPGSSGSTVIRCTFIGVSSITFNCVYNGESNYDYLTVGSIDTSCTRSSYGTTLKGTSGTAKDITFTCDTGSHYVEFCYSKDSSVDTSPDNATVYIKSIS